MQQAITWANVHPNLCRHKALLGDNELINVANRYFLSAFQAIEKPC